MVEAGLQYVGFWARVGASIIDTLILIVVTTPLMIWIYGSAYHLDTDRGLIPGPADLLIMLVLPAAATVLFWRYKQATPGKMLLSMRIVDVDTGQSLSARQSLVRYVGYFVSIFPLGLGLIWVAFDARSQGWHDKIAKTVVVRTRKRDA